MDFLLIIALIFVLGAASFVAGIAYTRRAMRRNPEGFARNVLKAKALTAEARARWEAVVEQLSKASRG